MSRRPRTTQLRARMLVGPNVRGVWLVTDPGHSLIDLAQDATRDLPNLLFDLSVEAAGDGDWHLETRGVGLWLVYMAPVRPWVDPVRYRDRRASRH